MNNWTVKKKEAIKFRLQDVTEFYNVYIIPKVMSLEQNLEIRK